MHRFFLQPVIVSTWLLYSCIYVWGILILYLSIYNVFADLAGKEWAVHRFFLQPVIASTWLLYTCTFVWAVLILYLYCICQFILCLPIYIVFVILYCVCRFGRKEMRLHSGSAAKAFRVCTVNVFPPYVPKLRQKSLRQFWFVNVFWFFFTANDILPACSLGMAMRVYLLMRSRCA